MSQETTRYSGVARTLHWTIAVLVLVMVPLGIAIAKQWVGPVLYDLHKTLGVIVAALIVVRIAYRLTHTPPALPADITPVQRLAAGTVHFLLYALLLLQP